MNQTPEDEKFVKAFREQQQVPFRAELAQRIKTEAAKMKSDSTLNQIQRGRETKRIRIRLSSVFAGLALVAAFLFVIWNVGGSRMSLWSGAKPLTTGAQSNNLQTSYGLQIAPLKVTKMWTGANQGYPAGSVVFAELTNTGKIPLYNSDVVGVLSFTPTGQAVTSYSATEGQLSSNWLTFVSGPLQAIAPGQTVTWFFHPVGAPHSANGQLSEAPHVVFYNSDLVSQSKADVVWQTSQAAVVNLQVTPRELLGRGQSIQLSGDLRNQTNKPIQLSSLIALIWFTQSSSSTFMDPSAVRFIDHLHPVNTKKTMILPGQTVAVYFRLIGAASTDFFSSTPHVALVVRPK